MAWTIALGVELVIVASIVLVGISEFATGRRLMWKASNQSRRRLLLNRLWSLGIAFVGSAFGSSAFLELTGRHAPDWLRILQLLAQIVFVAMLLLVVASAIQTFSASNHRRMSMSNGGGLHPGEHKSVAAQRSQVLLWILFIVVVALTLTFWVLWSNLSR